MVNLAPGTTRRWRVLQDPAGPLYIRCDRSSREHSYVMNFSAREKPEGQPAGAFLENGADARGFLQAALDEAWRLGLRPERKVSEV